MADISKEFDKDVIKFDRKMINQISLDEELSKIKACIQCGECSASCPSGRWSAMRTRKLIRKALVGLESVLSEPDIWMCTTCFNCYERCPRTIPVTDIILRLRNIAVKNGFLSDPLKSVIKNLVTTGHGVPVGGEDSNWVRLRKFLDLEPLPPTVHKHKDALEEVQKLMEKIKFDERIPYKT